MNRYVPRLALAAVLCALGSPVRADDVKPAPSNRTPGIPEDASNWIELQSVPWEEGTAGADKPFMKMTYWCHKTDCDVDNYKGSGKNPVEGTGENSYRSGVPIYTLLPKKDPDVHLPYFRAVPAPWGLEVSHFSGSFGGKGTDLYHLFTYGKYGFFSPATAEFNLKPVAGTLASGQVVVDRDEPRDTGKPLPRSFTDDSPCTTAGFDQYYGSGRNADEANADRFFLPIEFELERAQLTFGPMAARVHSATVDGQPFSTMVASVKDGNSLLFADRFVQTVRPMIRTTAMMYYNIATGGPPDEFSPFEKRFLHCRMGFAGGVDKWMADAAAASADPAALTKFVSSWRDFLRGEVSYYVQKQTPPPGPRDDWQAYNSKTDWDEMVSRTTQWLNDGKLTAPAAPAQPVQTKAAATAAKPVLTKKVAAHIEDTEKSALDLMK